MNNLTNPSSKIPILYQDEDLLMVNKPPGVLSIQDGYDPTLPHLQTLLKPHYSDLWIVHRLDKETSGVMVLARDAAAHRSLNQQFREQKITKIYHGLVTPIPDWREKEIKLPLRVDADRAHRTRVDQNLGKPAHSIVRILKIFRLGVLMEIQIKTGITHQVRAHLRAFNLALFGDSLYAAGLPQQPIRVPRTMLHAKNIRLIHPRTAANMSFAAPYFDDFRQTYTRLRATTAQDGSL